MSCKIVILGESGVGKTCIMNKFLGNEFSEEHITTIAAEIGRASCRERVDKKLLEQLLKCFIKELIL